MAQWRQLVDNAASLSMSERARQRAGMFLESEQQGQHSVDCICTLK